MITLEEVKTQIEDIAVLRIADLTEKRVDSLRLAIADFCKRSGSPANPLAVWALVQGILTGRAAGEIWCQWEGHECLGYFINETHQDLDGKWRLFILHAWGNPHRPISEHRKQTDLMLKDAFEKGIDRIQFITRRNEDAFQRWEQDRFKKVGILFEARR